MVRFPKATVDAVAKRRKLRSTSSPRSSDDEETNEPSQPSVASLPPARPSILGSESDDDDSKPSAVPSLQDFGSRPIVNLTHSYQSMANNEKRVFFLRIAQIVDVNEVVLFLLVQPKNPYHSNWAEAVLHNMVREQKELFIRKLNMLGRNVLKYIIGNDKQLNSKAYPFRLFAIPCKDAVTNPNMRRLLQSVANNMNQHNKISEQNIIQVPDDFIFNQEPVWSDLIGYEAAYIHLTATTGVPTSAEYCTRNQEILRTHFRQGDLPMRFARKMMAPPDEMQAFTQNVSQEIEENVSELHDEAGDDSDDED